MSSRTHPRPAFYALEPGGWRDYWTILHPPYTLWHLSYVVVGAALAPEWRPGRLGAALAAFLLALGVGAHALDELHGRPLRTRIPTRVLAGAAAVSVAGACAIGVVVALQTTPWLLAFVGVGSFLVVAYNLELFGGRFHTDGWFALAWGAFPLLTAYFAAAGRLTWVAIAAAAFAALLSLAQRVLSAQVRTLRRRVASVDGRITFDDGRSEPLREGTLVGPAEVALRVLAASSIALAVTLVLLRVT